MATKSKNTTGQSAPGGGPALHFEHIERRESGPYVIDVRVIEMIDLYPTYIESLTGHQPDAGEVVEKCVEKILSADAGFKKFLANRTVKPATTSAKGSGAASRTEPAAGPKNSKSGGHEVASQQIQ